MAYHMNTKVSSYETERDLVETFEKWGVRDYQIDFNVLRSKHSNYTLSKQERGVTVRWVPRGSDHEVVLSMDQHPRPQDNIRVLYLAIEALRMNERRGIGDAMRSAYMQLNAPSSHWEILGLSGPASGEEINRAYRERAKSAHPDIHGGSDEAMAKLNAARLAALREAR